MKTMLRRVVYWLRQSRHDAELREEIQAHQALRAAALQRDGLSPEDAAAASRRALGNVLLAREEARAVWLGSVDDWWRDLRYGARTLRRSPGFTAVAAVTLALGIGINTGIFTVINAILFRDLSAPNAHELVSIEQSVHGVPARTGATRFSTSEYFSYRDRTRTLSGLAAVANARGEATLGTESPLRVLGLLVSCNYFAVLQQPPAHGRAFTAADCARGAELVVVLSHELWRTALAADPAIVGRTVRMNRQPVTVVGVAAEDRSSFLKGGYFAPLSAGRLLSVGDSRYDEDGTPWLTLIGRRTEGTSLAQVQAELDVLAAQIDRQQPGRATTLLVDRAGPADPMQLRRSAAGAATVLMAAFGFILLIACANVANLLLARGTARRQEIGIRVSLGASRAQVVRQLVTECLLISVTGGLLGSVLAVWSFQALVSLAVPALLPPWFQMIVTVDMSPDLEVLTFAVALTLGTGFLFGLVPAWQVSKPDLRGIMQQDSPASGSGRGGSRLRATLVGVQVGLCMVLMIAAGLLLRGLHATYTTDPGFEYRDVAFFSLESAFDGYSEEEAEAARLRVMHAVSAVRGVAAVASAVQEPLGDDTAPAVFRLPGESAQQSRAGEVLAVSSRYFSVLEMPIVRGRAFSEAEVTSQAAGPRPSIVSETTARNLWPAADPLGRTLQWEVPGLDSINTLQVVGVVADAQVNAIGHIDPYLVYVPGEGGAVLVKGGTDIATTISLVRGALRAVDPTLPLTVLPLESTLGWSRGIAAAVTSLFGGLGVLALALAAVGIYGVVAFVVAGRRREMGIRLALGATRRGLLGLVLGRTLRPVAVGAAVGVVAAMGTSRILASVLFGVSPADPVGLGGATLLVFGVAAIAGVLGARPATHADPTATLRDP